MPDRKKKGELVVVGNKKRVSFRATPEEYARYKRKSASKRTLANYLSLIETFGCLRLLSGALRQNLDSSLLAFFSSTDAELAASTPLLSLTLVILEDFYKCARPRGFLLFFHVNGRCKERFAIDHVEKDQPTTQIKTVPFFGTSKGRCSFLCEGRLSEVQ